MVPVDTIRRVETPEGVELHVHPAGPVVRALAFFVDFLLVWIGLGLAALGIVWLGSVGVGLWLILAFLAHWLYPVCFEVLWRGQTPGKRALKLQVLMRDGLPVGWGPSLLRNLLRFVDGLPFAYTVGLVAMLLSRDFQRVGDLVANTVVVHLPEPHRASPIPEVPGVQPPGILTVEEQSAILAFGERSATLTPARAQEVGDCLQALTGAEGEAGVRALQGMARHIRGGR